MSDPHLQGTQPRHLPRPSSVYGTGRVCEAEGCATKLSMYNPVRRCWQHTELNFPNYRGKRLQPGGA